MRLRNIPRAEGVLKECSQVIETPEEFRGHWASDVFQNDYPVHIEIGMGKGQFIMGMAKAHTDINYIGIEKCRFLMALAQKNPQINYIGIERYTSVLLRAVEKLNIYIEENESTLPNIRFICMDAQDIANVFAENEVDRIYLNFSDPWPKARHARRRLTSPDFFARYDKVLVQDGQVEFKTDNRDLFDFSVESLGESETWGISECTYDLHHDEIMNVGNIMTEYEEKFSSMDHPICKLIAKRRCLL